MDYLKLAIDKGELINCGEYGCVIKFNLNDLDKTKENKFLCLKIFYVIGYSYTNIVERFHLIKTDKILKNVYDCFLSEIYCLNYINQIKSDFKLCPQIFASGDISNKNIIKLISKKINKNIYGDLISYFVMDFIDGVPLDNLMIKEFEYNQLDIINFDINEIHTYLFYVIYFLYLINSKFNFFHNDLHTRNILLIKDNDFNIKDYRIIKMNNINYKVKIYKYIPVLIDFSNGSILDKNIINYNINNYYNYDLIKFDGKKFITVKNKNIIKDLIKIFLIFIMNIDYKQIDKFIKYNKKFNINKLYDILKYKKEHINIIHNNHINNLDKYIDVFILDNFINKLNDDDVFNFIARFKL